VNPYHWAYDAARAKGAANELGAHMIDVARWFLGDVARVSASMQSMCVWWPWSSVRSSVSIPLGDLGGESERAHAQHVDRQVGQPRMLPDERSTGAEVSHIRWHRTRSGAHELRT